jgi:putative mRNA 3-end processing factor
VEVCTGGAVKDENLTSSLCLYKYRQYLDHVKILHTGAIRVGKNIAIDGYAEVQVRVVTHAHLDHVVGLSDSIKSSKKIVGTPITLDLLEILGYVEKELAPLYRLKKTPLDYYTPLKVGDDTLTLLNADHIPGSSQVLVELGDPKIRVGYTGDFKLTSKTDIIEAPDVLIIESTYGNPLYRRRFKDVVNQVLVDLVLEGLYRYKRVYVYAYHGKIQEVMGILREGGISAPFVLPDKVYRATKHLEERYGFKYGPYYRDDEVATSKNGLVVFRHFNHARNRKLDGMSLHIVLTGRYTQDPYLKVDDYTYVVSLSDHADFEDLIRYIEKSNPQLVIIDGSRPGDAEALKNALTEKGFCSIVLPEGDLPR